jgi:hypothetical protein
MTLLSVSLTLGKAPEDMLTVMPQVSTILVVSTKAGIIATVSEKWLQHHFHKLSTVQTMLALNSAAALVLFSMVRDQARRLAKTCPPPR